MAGSPRLVLSTVLLAAALLPASQQRAAATPDFTKVRQLVAEHLAKDLYPSMSIAVARNGRILWEEGFGWADRENRVPATPHTMYYTASVTKTFTETALMILHERKKLDLDRPANEYLGEAKLRSPAFDVSQATVRRVAMHTAGLTTFNTARALAMDEMIRRYGVVFWPPGERFDYSNLGPIMIEEIIARAAGRRYPDFLRDEVLRPLGLTRTSAGLDPDLERHAAKRYDWAGGFAPHSRTSVYSSAHDLVRFGMFHLKTRLPDQRPILSDAAIDAMQNSTVAAGSRRYGLSWWIDEDRHGYRSVMNQGGTTWDLAWLRLIPSEGVAAAVLANKGNYAPANEVVEEVIAAVLPAYGERRAQAPPAAPAPRPNEAVPPEAYVGHWRGAVKTHRGDVPLALSVGASGETRVKLGEQPEQSLAGARFNAVRLSGRIDGDLGVEDDTGDARYHIGLLLFLRGDALQGPAVTGPGAQLPFWTELRRESGKPR